MDQQPTPPSPPSDRSSPPQQQQQPPPPPSLTPTPPPSSASTTAAPSLTTSPATTSLPPPSSTPPLSSTPPTLNPPASTSLTPTSQNPQSRPSFHHLAHPPSSLTLPPPARGGLAIGVPAHQPGPSPSPPPASFSSLAPPSFGQQFGGLGRGMPDSSSAKGRPVQGMQGIGITGSLGSSMPMRPIGATPQPVRSITTSIRQQTVTSSQSPSSQSFQGHGMLRSPNPLSTSQSPQSQNQAWLSSGVQGKPPLPPPSLRPQLSQQSLQQRSHIRPQHHHSVSTSQQQQHTSSTQQAQPSISSQSQENLGQQIQSSRTQQPFPNQPPIARSHGFGTQRPSSHALLQSAAVQSGPLNKTSAAETEEPCNRILSKRSIQELVAQIDPSEKLDLGVEDILVDIADEFVESLTNFGCSLAKHRKSSTLEAKDILLHAERHWNITLPGFSGDEIRTYKKPLTCDIHRERLAAIKRSSLAVKTTNPKSSAGQSGNSKSPFGKGPTNILTSPNAKT